MEFVKKLLESVEYKNRLRKLKEMEQDRVYCRHDLDHFLHVARIACLLSVEQGLELDKEQVYLCALLHDLGRVEEYGAGISHAEASGAAAGGDFCAFWVTMRRKRGRSAMPFPITVEG